MSGMAEDLVSGQVPVRGRPRNSGWTGTGYGFI